MGDRSLNQSLEVISSCGDRAILDAKNQAALGMGWCDRRTNKKVALQPPQRLQTTFITSF
jgi:hypothetical protein